VPEAGSTAHDRVEPKERSLMKNIRISFDHYGSPDLVTAGEEELPAPGESEVQVGIRAVAVNAMDWKVVAGYSSRL
jgi:enoyl reductase